METRLLVIATTVDETSLFEALQLNKLAGEQGTYCGNCLVC